MEKNKSWHDMIEKTEGHSEPEFSLDKEVENAGVRVYHEASELKRIQDETNGLVEAAGHSALVEKEAKSVKLPDEAKKSLFSKLAAGIARKLIKPFKTPDTYKEFIERQKRREGLKLQHAL